MGRLDGKVAIVTGGSRGVGAATARVFVEEGAQVMVTDVVDERGEEVASEIGENATYLHCDVSVESDWTAVMERTMAQHGRLDVLANIAAVMHLSLIVDTTPEDYLRVTKVNELGTFMGIRATIAPMTQSGGGSIINYASVWVVQPAPYTCAYGASKWAISGLTKCAAIELAPAGSGSTASTAPAAARSSSPTTRSRSGWASCSPAGTSGSTGRGSTAGRVPSTRPAPRRRPAPASSSRATRAPGTTAPTSPPAPS